MHVFDEIEIAIPDVADNFLIGENITHGLHVLKDLFDVIVGCFFRELIIDDFDSVVGDDKPVYSAANAGV